MWKYRTVNSWKVNILKVIQYIKTQLNVLQLHQLTMVSFGVLKNQIKNSSQNLQEILSRVLRNLIAIKNWSKTKHILCNTLRLNFCYFKTTHILQSLYYPEIMGHILKIKQTSKYIFIHDIIRLIIMKMKMKIKKDHIDTT